MTGAVNVIVRCGIRFFAVFEDPHGYGISASNACAAARFGRTVSLKSVSFARRES
jgi:hypothetical protein